MQNHNSSPLHTPPKAILFILILLIITSTSRCVDMVAAVTLRHTPTSSTITSAKTALHRDSGYHCFFLFFKGFCTLDTMGMAPRGYWDELLGVHGVHVARQNQGSVLVRLYIREIGRAQRM